MYKFFISILLYLSVIVLFTGVIDTGDVRAQGNSNPGNRDISPGCVSNMTVEEYLAESIRQWERAYTIIDRMPEPLADTDVKDSGPGKALCPHGKSAYVNANCAVTKTQIKTGDDPTGEKAAFNAAAQDSIDLFRLTYKEAVASVAFLGDADASAVREVNFVGIRTATGCGDTTGAVGGCVGVFRDAKTLALVDIADAIFAAQLYLGFCAGDSTTGRTDICDEVGTSTGVIIGGPPTKTTTTGP